MKFSKAIALVICFLATYALGRRVHKRHNKRNNKEVPCKYSLWSNSCSKYNKDGMKAECDQKWGICKRANGMNCAVTPMGRSEEEGDCLSGSKCNGTDETSGWGKCVDNSTRKDKIVKAAYAMGIKLE